MNTYKFDLLAMHTEGITKFSKYLAAQVGGLCVCVPVSMRECVFVHVHMHLDVLVYTYAVTDTH